MIYLDAVRFKQILINLISNSVKFTQTGYIKLSINYIFDKAKHKLKVSVFDTGIGIDPRNKAKLFKAFSQADTTITRKFGGTGLGLIISNNLVNEMGGKISFCSIPNTSTNFYFQIDIDIDEDDSFTLPLLTNNKVALSLANRVFTNVISTLLNEMGYTCISSDELFSYRDKQITDLGLIIGDIPWTKLDISKKQEELLLAIPTIILYDSNTKASIERLVNSRENCYMLEKPLLPWELAELIGRIKSKSNIQEPKVHQTLVADKPRSNYDVITQKTFKVLVAEDNRLNMLLITTILEKLLPKSIIDKAENGAIAYDMARKTDYDIILMDLQMPEMDGITATKMILRSKTENFPIIIAVTANVTQEDRDNSFDAGMKDFIAKPINKSILVEKLKHNLNL
jgi:CheY-like chemotaxis protein